MSVILDDGKRVIEPGDFTISVGGKQPGFTGSADAITTGIIGGTFTVAGKMFFINEN
jgi:beta-glucosidase